MCKIIRYPHHNKKNAIRRIFYLTCSVGRVCSTKVVAAIPSGALSTGVAVSVGTAGQPAIFYIY
jgi:hypothetical protein